MLYVVGTLSQHKIVCRVTHGGSDRGPLLDRANLTASAPARQDLAQSTAPTREPLRFYYSGAVFSYKLRCIVGFGLVEMTISTNPKPTIYRNLYENTGPVSSFAFQSFVFFCYAPNI